MTGCLYLTVALDDPHMHQALQVIASSEIGIWIHHFRKTSYCQSGGAYLVRLTWFCALYPIQLRLACIDTGICKSTCMQGMRTMQSDRGTLCQSLLFFRLCVGACDARAFFLFKRDNGQSTRAPFEDRQQMRRLLSCFCSSSSRTQAF